MVFFMVILLKMCRLATNTPPLRGPPPVMTLRIYVQAHRSGILRHNYRVWTGVQGPLGSNFMLQYVTK